MSKKTAPEKLPVMTEFVFGELAFVSNGISNLTVTRDGQRAILPVPIQSLGVLEKRENFENNAPKPPVRLEKIDPDTPEGKALGLTEPGLRKIMDHTDPQYLADLENHMDAMIWGEVIAGLDITFTDENGETVTDPAQIRAALENSGITSTHLERLFSDIRALTQATEESADFLSGNALDTPKASPKPSKKGRQKAAKPTPKPTTKPA